MSRQVGGWALLLAAIFFYVMVILGMLEIVGDADWGIYLAIVISIGFWFWLYRLTVYVEERSDNDD